MGGDHQSELQQGPGARVLLTLKVRPEAFPNGSPMPVWQNVLHPLKVHQSKMKDREIVFFWGMMSFHRIAEHSQYYQKVRYL